MKMNFCDENRTEKTAVEAVVYIDLKILPNLP